MCRLSKWAVEKGGRLREWEAKGLVERIRILGRGGRRRGGGKRVKILWQKSENERYGEKGSSLL